MGKLMLFIVETETGITYYHFARGTDAEAIIKKTFEQGYLVSLVDVPVKNVYIRFDEVDDCLDLNYKESKRAVKALSISQVSTMEFIGYFDEDENTWKLVREEQ